MGHFSVVLTVCVSMESTVVANCFKDLPKIHVLIFNLKDVHNRTINFICSTLKNILSNCWNNQESRENSWSSS